MPVLPDGNLAMIEWFENRIASWTANAAAIGLDTAQTTDLLAKSAAARTAYNNAQQARNASKAATSTLHTGADDLRGFGADLIKTIKAFAETTGDPGVYDLAEVPMPAAPEPVGPPGMPYDITTALDNNGFLELKWKADNGAASTGAYYMLERRLNGEASFTLIGGTGTKSFTDTKIPLATSQAIYKITPKRGELVGPASNQVVVQFGVNIPGPGGESAGEGGLTLAA